MDHTAFQPKRVADATAGDSAALVDDPNGDVQRFETLKWGRGGQPGLDQVSFPTDKTRYGKDTAAKDGLLSPTRPREKYQRSAQSPGNTFFGRQQQAEEARKADERKRQEERDARRAEREKEVQARREEEKEKERQRQEEAKRILGEEKEKQKEERKLAAKVRRKAAQEATRAKRQQEEEARRQEQEQAEAEAERQREVR